MISDIIDRIEQMRQDLSPKGYKRTKSGIVPKEWQEVKIGDYIIEYIEKTTISNQYPILTSARTGLMLQTEYYTNRQVTTDSNVGYNIIPYGYITFRSRSDDGHFRFNENKIIERGVISYFYPVFCFNDKVHQEYMLQLLNHSIYRRMYPYAEGTAQQVLSLKKLGQLSYALPPLDEQRKIAAILSTQDRLIDLYDRKIEQLQRFKKGVMGKLFPKPGCSTPEVRFPGFTGSWKQRKVGEVTTELIEYATLSSGLPLLTSSRTGIMYQTDYRGNVTTDNEHTLFSVVPLGACTYRHMSDDDIFHLNYNMLCKGLVSREYPVFVASGSNNLSFIIQYLNSSPTFVIFCKEQKKGGTRTRLYYNVLCNYQMMIPSTDEQKRIADYLSGLDRLITLHQHKRDEEIRKKKALMQLLLTGKVRVKL